MADYNRIVHEGEEWADHVIDSLKGLVTMEDYIESMHRFGYLLPYSWQSGFYLY